MWPNECHLRVWPSPSGLWGCIARAPHRRESARRSQHARAPEATAAQGPALSDPWAVTRCLLLLPPPFGNSSRTLRQCARCPQPESAGPSCASTNLTLFKHHGFIKKNSRPGASCVCFGRGASNPQGRWGEGGDLGVKCKGGGPSLRWGHAWISRLVPAKKLGDGRQGTVLVCAGFSASPKGELCVLLVGAPRTIKEDGGRGESQA